MISIIIVHYKNNEDLIECLNSLYTHKKGRPFEVIVVDNSSDKNLKRKLRKYNSVSYINSGENIGYGSGINLGSKFAKGEYLFILNPDTVFKTNILDKLISKVERYKKIGMIAPLLISPKGEILEQGAKELTPKRAIYKLSFIDKIWKNNPISKTYWVRNWNNKKLVAVDNVPGSAFIIRKDLFQKIGGFDENFFLYFEEFDLCRRVKKAGYKIYIDSSSRLIHKWGTTTKLLKNRDEIFRKSRFYYFKKHFGFLKALSVEAFLSINFWNTALISVVILAALVRLYRVDTLIPFYPDIGWFYISARDMLVSGHIPLVGIASSHVWLHQGPIWTYVLGFLFYFYDFNPITPAYFTAILDLFTLALLYKMVKYIFDKQTALTTSILYAFSPIIILSSRTPYHTSPIPFFVVLFLYSLFKWMDGKAKYFPLLIFTLAVLYNLELQAILFVTIFSAVFLYGFYRKTEWVKNILNLKTVALSILAFTIPMLPILIYDLRNGFPQTVVFAGWIFYKLFSFIVPTQSLTYGAPTSEMLVYFYNFFQELLFLPNAMIATVFVFASLLFLTYKTFVDKKERKAYLVILLLNVILLVSAYLTKSPADSYLMSMFVPIIIAVSLLYRFIATKINYVFILMVILIISVMNIYHLISNNYYFGFSKGYGPTFEDRVNAARYIVESSKDMEFSILGRGEGSEFESFPMGYSFLTWYLGKGPSIDYDLLYIIEESPKQIEIERKEI
jgi:GT2 family glycosyltransferase